MKQFRSKAKRGSSAVALFGYALALSLVGLAGLYRVGTGKDDAVSANKRLLSASPLSASMTGANAVKQRGAMTAGDRAAGDSALRNKAAQHPAAIPVSDFASFTDFLSALRTDALAKGIAGRLFDEAFAGMQADPEVIDFTTRQPEHERTPWDYVGALVSPQRIEDGRAMLKAHASVLQRIEAAYGVDRHILVALWGIETSYGSGQGQRNVLRSLATLAYKDKRRAAFWRRQLFAALRIVAAGDVSAKAMDGSWAGAMGHTQFMPTTYLSHAVDFDGDGKRNIWRSVPDALASAANYLKASHWTAGRPWGFEVILPDGFDYGLSAPGNARSIVDWLTLGVGAIKGQKLPTNAGPLQLLLPAGAAGPAFLVSSNFKAILKYNNSSLYALSAGLLASRLGGGPGITRPWPIDIKPLARPQRRELQQLLVNRGLDTGGIDGILGGRSRAAIRSYQLGEKLPADGFPTTEILARLRRTAPSGKKAAAAIAAGRQQSGAARPGIKSDSKSGIKSGSKPGSKSGSKSGSQ